MVVLIHVIIAVLSLAAATYALVSPGRNLIRLAFILVGLTLASGVLLVALQPAHIARICLTGLVYTGYVTAALVTSGRRLRLVAAS